MRTTFDSRSRFSRLGTAALILGMSAVAVPRAIAQQGGAVGRSAQLTGVVRDSAGTPITDADVRIPALERGTSTGRDGQFTLAKLPIGKLVLTVRAVGYQPHTAIVDLATRVDAPLAIHLMPSHLSLAAVAVTGAATATDPTTPMDVAAISPAELRMTSKTSLGKTLERVPGVVAITTGPMAGNPVLRGMSQGQVRLTRDGIPIESFQGTSRWTPPISFGSVDRIEVIRGPASVLYGSSAMGGAVNFLPKVLPRTDAGHPVLNGLVETQYFANNHDRYVNGEIDGAIGRGVGFRAGMNRRVAGNFRTADHGTYAVTGKKGDPLFAGILPYTNYEQSAAYGQLGYADTWGQAQLLYDGFEGFNNFLNTSGRPTGVGMSNHEARAKATILRGAFVIKPSMTRQELRIQRAASAAKTYEAARTTDAWDQDLSRSVTTARIDAEHGTIAGLAGRVGIELQEQRGTTRKSRIEPSSRIRNVAVFLFEEARWSRTTVTGGVRYDQRTQRADLGSLVRALPEQDREDALRRTFSVATGSLGVGVRLSDAITWTSNVSTGFRAPAVQDLYTDENRPAFGYLQGNPQLRPERSTSIESALRVQGARIAGSVGAYRNAVANYIYMENTGRTTLVAGQARNVYTNRQDDAVISGIEASLDAELGARFFAEGSAMMLRSENRATGEALPLMPADQLRAAVRWSPSRLPLLHAPNVRVGWRHSRHKRIAGPTEPFAEFDNNPLGYGISSTPAYSVWEGSIGGRIGGARMPIDVMLEVQNALDTPYRDFLDTQKGFTVAQGRNVSVRLSAPFRILR